MAEDGKNPIYSTPTVKTILCKFAKHYRSTLHKMLLWVFNCEAAHVQRTTDIL